MKTRIIFSFICFCSLFCILNVHASNDINYTLRITKDYSFKEVIEYSITDYTQIKNGENYFYNIINYDVYSDIFYNTKYKKTKVLKNNKYYVKLSNTYNEYTMSNANFLNNCFEKKSFDYNMNVISYVGKEGFKCLYADNLTIKIITDFEVIESNAVVNGNTYTWTPNNNSFSMNIKIRKTYENNETSGNVKATDYDDEENSQEIITEESKNNKVKEEKKSVNPTIIIIGLSAFIICGGIVVIVLKIRNNNINKI